MEQNARASQLKFFARFMFVSTLSAVYNTARQKEGVYLLYKMPSSTVIKHTKDLVYVGL